MHLLEGEDPIATWRRPRISASEDIGETQPALDPVPIGQEGLDLICARDSSQCSRASRPAESPAHGRARGGAYRQPDSSPLERELPTARGEGGAQLPPAVLYLTEHRGRWRRITAPLAHFETRWKPKGWASAARFVFTSHRLDAAELVPPGRAGVCLLDGAQSEPPKKRQKAAA